MNSLRNPVAAFVLMSMLIALSLGIYEGFSDAYDYTEQDLVDQKNIFEHLSELDLVSGANSAQNAINQIQNPANPRDLLGALASAGIGILQIIKGIVLFPLQITTVIGSFYSVPPIVGTSLGLIFNVYVFFVILSAYLGRDI